MSAFQTLMTRLGYVKLGRFGLALTPEGRILSMRPAALDDGLGARIVGWEDGDLAAMELARWEPVRPSQDKVPAGHAWHAQPAPMPAMTPRVAVAMPPPVPMRAKSPTMNVPTVVPIAPVISSLPGVAPFTPAAAPVVVAQPPEPEEDWEWTIAIARARAAAEEAEQAAEALRDARPAPIIQLVPDTSKTAPMAAVAAPKTTPMAAVAAPKVSSFRQPMPLPAPPALRVVPAGPSRTVIPVPSLPTLGDRRLEPVVRTSTSAMAAPVRRFPKGTLDHDTVTKLEAVAESEDDTQTGISLPPVALPSIRRRMSSNC
jgi:hypothetical protein